MKRCPALFLAGALAAGAVATASADDVIRLGNLKFAHYGAVWYMKEIAPKYHLRIEEQIFAKGIDIFPAILAGQIDASASGTDAAVAARASGIPITIVAGFAKGGVRIVGRTDLGLHTVEELRGHKVGVARGGAQELFLLAELSQHHLTWSDRPGQDVQLFYLAYVDLNQAIRSGNLDAMCQSEPYASLAIAQGYGTEIAKPYDTPLGESVRALVMTDRLYQEHPDVALRFLECFVEATRKFIAQPEFAEAYVRGVMFKHQLSSADYLAAISNSPFTDEITAAQVQVTIDCMVKFGVGKMTAPPVAKDFVRLDLLAKAKAELAAR
jgi:NitT/TauT family transport system substrate-binding protein